MSRGNDTGIFDVVHPFCCGLDVHKEAITATLLITTKGGSVSEEVREFGTFTQDLWGLREWIVSQGCPMVAMESTGVYWRPVHNVLEGVCSVVLVNARHVKNVPGRKTDISDSRWLATLLRNGMLKASFIPPRHVREWRDLARMRRVYVADLADYKRRVHKLFECANIKIDSVVTDLFGVTGRNLINLLAVGEGIRMSEVQGCTRGKLKAKAAELFQSLQGYFTEHHRFMLMTMLETIRMLEDQIARVHKRLTALLCDRREKIRRLCEVPGIDEVSAHAVLGEVGDTLEQFNSPGAFAFWAGLCPGNNESAGKRQSGRSPVRKHPFKSIMVEIAWGAVKKKGSYYREKYYRLKARLGSKKAIVAIAHRIVKAIYRILSEGLAYRELGDTYLIEMHRDARLRFLERQAALLGYQLVPTE
jgi:transposase